METSERAESADEGFFAQAGAGSAETERTTAVPHRIHEYPELVGKTVAKITVTNESDFRCITVKFADNTAIHFGIRPFINIEPEHLDWTTGDGKVLRCYPFVREKRT